MRVRFNRRAPDETVVLLQSLSGRMIDRGPHFHGRSHRRDNRCIPSSLLARKQPTNCIVERFQDACPLINQILLNNNKWLEEEAGGPVPATWSKTGHNRDRCRAVATWRLAAQRIPSRFNFYDRGKIIIMSDE